MVFVVGRWSRPIAIRASAGCALRETLGQRGRGRRARVLGGDARAQDTGADAESQRRLELAASPSMPAATGRSASTSKVGAVHSARAAAPAVAAVGAPRTVIPSSASSIRGRVPEPTALPSR